ncbi:MAG: transposase [Streptosporangiales bacterium]|nr:transposase [Streptosporangiales bacterium]
MASVVGKRVGGRTYYYLAESARVRGEPRIVSQRYLGSADDIAAAVRARPGGAPVDSTHLAFGDVAAGWRVLTDLGLPDLVDGIVGRQRAEVSAGTYLALAVLHRLVAPGSETGLAAWWPTTAAPRFVRPRLPAAALERRRVRRALGRLAGGHREDIEAALLVRVRNELGSHGPSLVLDLPGFATFLDGTNPHADADPSPHGDRGPRARMAGLAVVVTLDGAVPLVARSYQHLRGDDTSFPALTAELTDRFRAALGGDTPLTVVTGADQAAPQNHAGGPHFVGPLPSSEHPDLIAARLTVPRAVNPAHLPGVTALDGRARVAGVDRRVIRVHSTNLQAAQTRALAQDLAHATRRLDELASALRLGVVDRPRAEIAAEVARIARFRWSDRVLSTRLDRTSGGGLTLTWHVDERAYARLRSELFGKQLLTTDHDDWSVPQVITAYRARYHLESTLTHLGGPLVPAPTPAWRWTDDDVEVHGLVTVLATTVAHLMRRRAQRVGLDLSVRELFRRLADVEETRLRYPSTGGRPRTRHVLAEHGDTARSLVDLFDLTAYAPRS